MNKKTKITIAVLVALSIYIALFIYFPFVAAVLLLAEISGVVGVSIYKDNKQTA